MSQDDDPHLIERQLEQAERLAPAAATDPTTYQRIKAFIEELRQKLQRRRLARKTKEGVRARARELWDQHGRPPGRDLDFWLEAERQLGGNDGGKDADG